MSRIAKNPIQIPKEVEVKIQDQELSVKGKLGELKIQINKEVELLIQDQELKVQTKEEGKFAHAISGTLRAIINNMVQGVHLGFEKKLQLQGVGYRAKATDSKLELALGFSHPINYDIPKGITIQTPSQTEIVVKGIDKQKVGQIAAEIRAFRPPEPYKGKGVRYLGERVNLKEVKKK